MRSTAADPYWGMYVGLRYVYDGRWIVENVAARRATPGMHRRLARVTKTSSSFSAEAVVGRAL